MDYVIKLNKFGKCFSCFISLRACEFCATFYGFVVIEMKPFMSLWSWNLAFSPCKYVLIQLLVGLVSGFLIGFGDQVTTEKNWTVLKHLLCTVDMFLLRHSMIFLFPKWSCMGPVGSQNRCSTENCPFKKYLLLLNIVFSLCCGQVLPIRSQIMFRSLSNGNLIHTPDTLLDTPPLHQFGALFTFRAALIPNSCPCRFHLFPDVSVAVAPLLQPSAC